MIPEGDNMAQEYILINNDKENGMITLSKGVFDAIMLISIEDEENVFPVESGALRKSSNCKIVNNELIVNVDVKLKHVKIYNNALIHPFFK